MQPEQHEAWWAGAARSCTTATRACGAASPASRRSVCGRCAKHELRPQHPVKRHDLLLQARAGAHTPFGAEFKLTLRIGIAQRQANRRGAAAMGREHVLQMA